MTNLISIEGFQISELIYESKNTKVYKGVKTENNQAVIIKLLNKSRPTLSELTRFREEYKIAKKINSANQSVIQTYSLIKHENTLLMVIEDSGGETLEYILKQKKLSLKEFLKISIQTANSIHEIHSRNVIHKDIKPAHIIWCKSEDVVKIFDFGISTQLTREITEIVNLDKLEGTLQYISPEQTGRMNRSIDYRTDLYSLGVVLYEALTGINPFTGSDSMEIVHNHITKIPDALSVVNNKIPQTISNIVMKLLEKTAEKRYQSSLGLKNDLEKCLELLNKNGVINDFKIAKNDFSDKFKLPQKIYGREKELETLFSSFDETARGVNNLLLITGSSGVGKSALVNEIHKPIVEKKGFFISGKFNQYNENVPYSAISQALSVLVKELLSENKEKLNEWKAELLKVAGPNGQLLIDIIPEIEKIIGKQPAVQELNPVEAQNRFIMIFRNFIKIIARPNHPLVIFLDDLQWCDIASLNIIKDLSTKDIPYLMLICSYRENEVGEGHPFKLSIDEISKSKKIESIKLKTLTQDIVNQIVADTLFGSEEQTKNLSDIIYSKSKGNPFFTYELIKNLYKQKLININHSIRKWSWELDKIKKSNISDNVVEFMIGRLKTLTNNSVAALKYASCIGNTFNLKMLSVIMQKPLEETSEMLDVIIQEEIIFVRGNKFSEDKSTTYKFQHDRIQEAAYSLIEDEKKQEIHLEIGRMFLENYSKEEIKKHLITIVNHLNISVNLISKLEEKEQLSVLNLQAGEKALNSQAYSSAYTFFDAGILLLTNNTWQNNYQVTFDLFKGFSQTAYLIGKQTEAESKIEILLENAKTKIEKVNIISMRLRQYTTIGKSDKAIEVGLKGLLILGIKLSAKPGMANVLSEIVKAKLKIGRRKIADLINEPILEDPEQKAASRLLSELGAPAYVLGNDVLYGLLALKVVNLSLKYGNSPESPYAYVAYGMLLSEAFGDMKSCYEFGVLALNLNEKLNDIEYRCRVIAAYCVLTHHWNKHWSTLTDWYKKGIEAGFNSGDIFYLAHSAVNCVVWNPKLHLETLMEQHSKYLSILYDTEYDDAIISGEMQMQKFRNFRGLTNNRLSLSDENFDEEKLFSNMQERKFISGIAMYNVHKADVALFYHEYLEAYNFVKEVDKNAKALVGLVYISYLSQIAFYTASACMSDNAIVSVDNRELLKRMKKEMKKMKKWAKHNPVNFQHILLTMKAEFAKHKKQYSVAINLYEQAIKTAIKNGWYKDEAFANELIAKLYLEQGQSMAAMGYIQEAHYHYLRWGATEKVVFLEEKYSRLFKTFTSQIATFDSPKNQTVIISGATSTHPSTTTNNTTNAINALDLTTIIKSSQTISREIVVETLFEKLIQIVIENAGATRGLLLLSQDNELRIQAEINTQSNKTTVLQNTVVTDNKNIPHQLINYVANTLNSVVLPNKTNKEQFSQDAYILQHSSISMFAIPIVKKNELYGILYLENNIATNVFTSKRQEILNLLSSQIAVSIENALLYENLENKVEQRTKELSSANSKLEVVFKELSKQKDKIEKSHEQITSSINYAKRIQTAMLPTEELFVEYFAEHFILFKPRDIVSGDFYWAKKTGNTLIYTAADCTGHGVPGAFVSMLGMSLLNEITLRLETVNTAVILNKLRKTIKTLLKQSSDDIQTSKDGMDIALCAIDLDTNILQFSGAYNPLLIIRNDEIIQIKGDRQPIGVYFREKDFTFKSIQLHKNDILYIYSDGYIDQFGGKDYRKFMISTFKELLLKINKKPMSEQKIILEESFSNWRGDVKQIDDIVIVGTKI